MDCYLYTHSQKRILIIDCGVFWGCKQLQICAFLTNSMHHPTKRARCTMSSVISEDGRNSLSEPITDRPRFLFPPGTLYISTWEDRNTYFKQLLKKKKSPQSDRTLGVPVSVCSGRQPAPGRWCPSLWAPTPDPQTGLRTAEGLTPAAFCCSFHYRCGLPEKMTCTAEQMWFSTCVQEPFGVFWGHEWTSRTYVSFHSSRVKCFPPKKSGTRNFFFFF